MLVEEIVARFTADTRQFTAGVAKAEGEMSAFTASQTKATSAMGSLERQAVTAVRPLSALSAGATNAGRGVASAGRAISGTGGAAAKSAIGLGKAQSEMSKLSTTATAHLVPGLRAGETAMARFTASTQGGLSAGRAAFGLLGVAAVVGVGKAVEKTVELAGETRKLSRQLGLTAEDASRLRQVGHDLGVDTDALSRGFGIFAKNLSNDSKSLQKYGIEAVRASDGSVNFLGTLGEISDKFLSLPNGLDRTAFAMNVFGRSGKDLIPILSQGRRSLADLGVEAEKLGLVFSEKDLTAARELAIAHRELNAAFEGLQVSLGRGFLPVMKAVAEFTTEAVAAFNLLPGPVRAVAVGTVAVIGGLTALGVVVGFVRKGLGNLGIGFAEKAAAEAASIAADVAQAGAATVAGESFTLLIANASGAVVAEQAVAASATEATVAMDVQAASSGRLALAMSSGLARAGLVAGALVGTFLLLKAGADAANKRLEAARQTILKFGVGTSKSADAVGLIAAQTGKWVGSPGFRALGHLESDATRANPAIESLASAHEHLALAALAALQDTMRETAAMKTFTKEAQVSLPAVKGLANFLGTTAPELIGNTVKAWNDSRDAIANATTPDDVKKAQAIWSDFVNESLAKAREWKTGLADSLNFVKSSLSDLASSAKDSGQAVADALAGLGAKFDIGGISKSLRDSIAAAKQYQADWATVMKRAGSDASLVADAVAAMGDNAGGVLHDLAGASDSSFKSVVGDFKTVADQAKLTSSQILVAFSGQFKAMGDYRANLKLITKTFGDNANNIIEFLAGMGEQGGVILNALATSVRDGSKATARQVIDDFNRSGQKANDTASIIAHTLGRTLNQIRDILKKIAVTWGVNLEVDTSQALSELESFNQKAKGLGFSMQVDTSLHGGRRAGGHQTGWAVPGYGGGDVVPAWLEPGEGVIRKEAVRAHGGPRFVEMLNAQHFQVGGMVGLQNTAGALGDTRGYFANLSLLSEAVSHLVAPAAAGGAGVATPGQARAWLESALRLTGHAPPPYIGAEEIIAKYESGFNPRASNPNPPYAKGLMQTITSTFNAYAVPGYGDIWNPVDNAAASVRYQFSRYGDPNNVPGVVSIRAGGPYRPYHTGGVIPEPVVGIGSRSGSKYSFQEGESVSPSGEKTDWKRLEQHLEQAVRQGVERGIGQVRVMLDEYELQHAHLSASARRTGGRR